MADNTTTATHSTAGAELDTVVQGTEGEHGAMPHTGGDAVASTAAEGHGGAPHTEPKGWGIDATAWVALAMIVVLILLLVKKVPSAIGTALDRKIAGIRQQLDEAAQLRAEAEALRAEQEAKSAAAEAEAAAIVERARHEADTIVREAQANSDALIERRTRMAEDKIAAAERQALDEVRARAARAAAAAAETLIRREMDPESDRALVDRTIAGLTH
ncbi:MAG TPA: F0F1 ATP synthase subunit B [Allosphingosinicella sp.]|jgi:F-type H+-transporting ATPase subunit b